MNDTPAPELEVVLEVEQRSAGLRQRGRVGRDRPGGRGLWRRSVRVPSGRPCSAGVLLSLREASCLPVPRVAGCGPGRPRARARMLLGPRPDRAIRAGAPRGPHEAAAATPQRGSPVRDPRAQEPMATRGTGAMDDPPAPESEALLEAGRLGDGEEVPHDCNWVRGWVAKPAQRAQADGAGACGSRAARAAGGNADPERSEGDSEAPPAAPACSVARAGGPRAALDAPPERHGLGPRGKTNRPHAAKREIDPTRGTGRGEGLHATAISALRGTVRRGHSGSL